MKEPSEDRGDVRQSSAGTQVKERNAERQRAWDYLLNVLSRQAYTVAELRSKLARRKVPASLADELVNRLLELELVDDKTFASQYVAARKTSRGRLALKSELRRKGIAEEIADARLATLNDTQQLDAAVALLKKHAWRYRPQAHLGDVAVDSTAVGSVASGSGASGSGAFASEASGAVPDGATDLGVLLKAAARAKAFLARRGFSPDVVVEAVERVGWFEG